MTTTVTRDEFPDQIHDEVHSDESATYAAARERSAVLDQLIDEHAASDSSRWPGSSHARTCYVPSIS